MRRKLLRTKNFRETLFLRVQSGTSIEMHQLSLNPQVAGWKGVANSINHPARSQAKKLLPGGPIMTKALAATILTLSLTSVSFGGTIIGSRSNAAGARTGTIVGSRTGTMVGSRTGTIVGSQIDLRSQHSVDGGGMTVQDEFVIRLLVLVLGSSW